jgi:hypothetical protein
MSDYEAESIGRFSMYLEAPKSDNLIVSLPSNKILAPFKSA